MMPTAAENDEVQRIFSSSIKMKRTRMLLRMIKVQRTFSCKVLHMKMMKLNALVAFTCERHCPLWPWRHAGRPGT
jgi:hypothetical protein